MQNNIIFSSVSTLISCANVHIQKNVIMFIGCTPNNKKNENYCAKRKDEVQKILNLIFNSKFSIKSEKIFFADKLPTSHTQSCIKAVEETFSYYSSRVTFTFRLLT